MQVWGRVMRQQLGMFHQEMQVTRGEVFVTLALFRLVAKRLVVMHPTLGRGRKQLFASDQSLGAASSIPVRCGATTRRLRS